MASPCMAQSAEKTMSPGDLLPQVFTRPDYKTNRLADTTDTLKAQSEVEYAQQDLDLALQNFFYALEDLMQSATRYEAAAPSRQDAHYAQVQFTPDVMNSLRNSASSDRATNNTAAASVQGSNASPSPIRSREDDSPSLLRDFSYSATTSIQLEHNDNIYSSRTNERADQILRANVAGTAEKQSRTRALSFSAELNSGSYHQDSQNNYLDLNASTTFASLLGRRSRALGSIAYSSSHEDRGTGSTEGNQAFAISQPLEFESWVAEGIYELGSPQGRTRFVADAKTDRLRAKNFQDTDFVQARDRDINSITATAYYKLTQRFSILSELRHMDIEYTQDVESLSTDSTQTRLAFGTEWEASRKTVGSIRIGLQEKSYDDLPQQDTSSVSWEASIEWTPLPRTGIVFETLKDTEESQGFGAALDRTDYRISWSQQWTPRIGSNMSIFHGISEYQQETREDSINMLDSELTYALSSKASAMLKLTYIDNSSNVAEYGFERSQIQLGVNLELD